jgi:alcohol dehydrogenase (cytochrome c)
MTRHPGGFGLEYFTQGVSADGSVTNPYNTPDDHVAGGLIFRKQCVMCHGGEAIGGVGPPLNRSGLKHGDSDLAIYKVLRDGIPSTPMVPPGLDLIGRWQVIGYLRTLMLHDGGPEVIAKARVNINVSSEQIRSAGGRPDEWLTYSGSLDGRRYTPLSEITSANVSQLRIRWTQQFDNTDPTVESTPLVVGGTMFITEPPSNLVALDAKSGEVIWRYDRKVAADVWVCCGRFNRGVAILGQTIFLGTLDGYLVAINANTGKMIWETRVVEGTDGYSISAAPLIVNQSVIVGVAGGDAGIRGFLAAYDSETGKQQWRFNTIPGPGEPGHETWNNGGWQTGGGPTWITGSYDAFLDLIYWGVGNPAPDYLGAGRPGDNLFTNSVIALHAGTGKLAWYFQFTPHDEHDWDSNQTPVLTDVLINGIRRKVICWANRNGFYYVLDRVTGEFLAGVPYVEQTWAKGLDSKGRPITTDANQVSSTGRLTRPAESGATNWENTALDQRKGLIFVPATEGAAVFTNLGNVNPKDLNRKMFMGSLALNAELSTPVVRALDIATGARKWQYFSPPLKDYGDLHYYYSGLLATGGDLVFGASGGYAFALDSTTGLEKWRVFLGGDTRAAPISFTVDGRQVLAVSAGRSLFLFGL